VKRSLQKKLIQQQRKKNQRNNFVKIIVGLGNPGKKYEKTRHNIGFRVVEEMAKSLMSADKFKLKGDFRALINEGFVENEKVLLVKPQSYMNNSGESVSSIVNYFALSLDDLLIVSDDFSLPFAVLRFRQQGSSGGHNGLKSIIENIGHSRFSRLRVGIGLPEKVECAEYVLQNFSPAEEKRNPAVIKKCVEAIKFYMINGIEQTMNVYN